MLLREPGFAVNVLSSASNSKQKDFLMSLKAEHEIERISNTSSVFRKEYTLRKPSVSKSLASIGPAIRSSFDKKKYHK